MNLKLSAYGNKFSFGFLEQRIVEIYCGCFVFALF